MELSVENCWEKSGSTYEGLEKADWVAPGSELVAFVVGLLED